MSGKHTVSIVSVNDTDKQDSCCKKEVQAQQAEKGCCDDTDTYVKLDILKHRDDDQHPNIAFCPSFVISYAIVFLSNLPTDNSGFELHLQSGPHIAQLHTQPTLQVFRI
ncbi:MAG: hypothetical protein SFW35_10785 [Chitinophagales bacterium]|nr:hypothetical protein [Chitinophagales bacterium]